jgi:UDP-3-O-[3-hydroxymyristoyl] glucosamine N-acyltransferase
MITNIDLEEIGLSCTAQLQINQLGLSNTHLPNTLTFLDDEKYLEELNANSHVTAVVTNANLASHVKDKVTILSEDPRYDFYTLLNITGKRNRVVKDSVIHPTAQIHPTAYVSKTNVTIGANTIIYPNVTILDDVEIGDNCVVQSGTVIGSEGFEYKRTSKGILSVYHDGKIVIGNRVHIGANTCIDKGFSFKHTIIEDDIMIDNLIHVAHGVRIKRGAFIIAGTVLGGSTIIGEDVWLSINSSIAPGIEVKKKGFVSIGAVVTKTVNENEQVTGNFAIPHEQFLSNLKKKL